MSFTLRVVLLCITFAMIKSSSVFRLNFIKDLNGNTVVEVENGNKFTTDQLMNRKKIHLICEDGNGNMVPSKNMKNVNIKLWVTKLKTGYGAINVSVNVSKRLTPKGKRQIESYSGYVVDNHNTRRSPVGGSITLKCQIKKPENARLKRWSFFSSGGNTTAKPVEKTGTTLLSKTSTAATSTTEDDWWNFKEDDWPFKNMDDPFSETTTELSPTISEKPENTTNNTRNPNDLKVHHETIEIASKVEKGHSFTESRSELPETTTTKWAGHNEGKKIIIQDEDENPTKLNGATTTKLPGLYTTRPKTTTQTYLTETTTKSTRKIYVNKSKLPETGRKDLKTAVSMKTVRSKGFSGNIIPIHEDNDGPNTQIGNAENLTFICICQRFNAECIYNDLEMWCQCPNKFEFKPACYVGTKFRCDCPKGKTYDNHGNCIENVCRTRGRKECSQLNARCRLNREDPTKFECLCRKGNFMRQNGTCIPLKDTNVKVYDGNQTVHQGQTVFFRCRDEGNTRLPVHWRRPRNLTLSKFTIMEKSGTLVIRYSQPSDSGAYYCYAGLKYSRRVPHKIAHVKVIPHPCTKNQFECGTTKQCIDQRSVCDGLMHCDDNSDEIDCKWNQENNSDVEIEIEVDEGFMTVIQGNDVRVFCRDKGPRKLPVEWFRTNDQPLPLRSSVSDGHLLLKNVQPRDKGYYVCKAVGVLQQDRCCKKYVHLSVRLS